MKEKIKCIAIDDEPMALDVLDDYIDKVPYLEKLGLFNDAIKALEYISDNSVDLIFLDIHMPDLTGMQFLATLKEKKLTILTTAYSEYALQSYEFDAVDYLLKPISFNRFLKASEKAYKIWHNENSSPSEQDANLNIVIQIKSGHAVYNINTKDLLFIEGNGNYLNFQLKEKKILSLMKMTEALQLLPKHFKRVHKSYIINLNYIKKKTSRQVSIFDKNIPVSKTYKNNI